MVGHGQHGGVFHERHHRRCSQYGHVARAHSDGRYSLGYRQFTGMGLSYFNHGIKNSILVETIQFPQLGFLLIAQAGEITFPSRAKIDVPTPKFT
jgi:hypothetical protein